MGISAGLEIQISSAAPVGRCVNSARQTRPAPGVGAQAATRCRARRGVASTAHAKHRAPRSAARWVRPVCLVRGMPIRAPTAPAPVGQARRVRAGRCVRAACVCAMRRAARAAAATRAAGATRPRRPHAEWAASNASRARRSVIPARMGAAPATALRCARRARCAPVVRAAAIRRRARAAAVMVPSASQEPRPAPAVEAEIDVRSARPVVSVSLAVCPRAMVRFVCDWGRTAAR
jgi:hypothetical protein